MSALASILIAAAFLIASVSIVSTAFFWVLCLKKEKSWAKETPLVKEERWALERKRTRAGLVTIVGYAVCAIISIVLKDKFDVPYSVYLATALLPTAALLVVALRAMIHNDRNFKASLKRFR